VVGVVLSRRAGKVIVGVEASVAVLPGRSGTERRGAGDDGDNVVLFLHAAPPTSPVDAAELGVGHSDPRSAAAAVRVSLVAGGSIRGVRHGAPSFLSRVTVLIPAEGGRNKSH